MEGWLDHLFLSRLQCALTTGTHILWPLLSIGLGLFLVLREGLRLKSGEVTCFHHCPFWGRLFLFNCAVEVARGPREEWQGPQDTGSSPRQPFFSRSLYG